jgi:predicted alpha/beta hydrolase family esterase
MPSDEANHAAYVEAWLTEAARGLPPALLISLFERATSALWQRTHVTLGEVTLAAIIDRVLYTASENYPFLSTLKVDETGIRFDQFRQEEAVRHDGHLTAAVLFVLAEFLTVLGHLTDEILTPALHTELSKVALGEPEPAGGVTRKIQGRS